MSQAVEHVTAAVMQAAGPEEVEGLASQKAPKNFLNGQVLSFNFHRQMWLFPCTHPEHFIRADHFATNTTAHASLWAALRLH